MVTRENFHMASLPATEPILISRWNSQVVQACQPLVIRGSNGIADRCTSQSSS